MAKDLKHFLNRLQKNYPDLLMKIKEEIHPGDFEITALLSLLERKGQEKMVLFEKTLSVDGSNALPLISNVFFSRGVIALALDLAIEDCHMELVEEFAKRERVPGNLERVPASEAPCKEVIWEGDSANLLKLPVPLHHEKDVGPYLTMTCIMKGQLSPGPIGTRTWR